MLSIFLVTKADRWWNLGAPNSPKSIANRIDEGYARRLRTADAVDDPAISLGSLCDLNRYRCWND